jgi:acetate kinase
MTILVLNCGSSSVKADLVDPVSGARVGSARAQRLGTPSAQLEINGTTVVMGGADHEAALGVAIPALLACLEDGAALCGVGHRVVHGGAEFSAPTRLDAVSIAAIEGLCSLAPLHNPPALAGIRAAMAQLPELPHIAVFDTAFHSTLPRRAQAYALPAELAAKHGIRRYGFHGTSHQYVARSAAEFLGAEIGELRIITAHLGNGCSVTAVEGGRSVETSMGMTPLEGLVMGTRCGDVDAGVLLHLMREEGLDVDGLDTLLNRKSGLAGLSVVGGDMRDIEARAAEGDEHCRLAIQVTAHRLRKYVGAYAAVMGGVDVIVFTGGIGENSALMRHRVCQRLGFLGAQLDEDRNRDIALSASAPVARLSSANSRVQLLAIATDESREIARQVAALVGEEDQVQPISGIPIAISARHIHLTQETVEALFGEGHTLTHYRDISQPGQFACEEKVNLIGPKRRIDGVRILGPTRPGNQIEVSRTDEFRLGLDAPVRNSGDVKQSPGITLEGPAGTVQLAEGVICARRHIHMHPDDAARFGVSDRDIVEVAVDSDGRDLIFGDVLVRVSDKYVLEMHIDTDEANAAELSRGVQGMLVSTGAMATLRSRKAT